jgi:hypothetical protein
MADVRNPHGYNAINSNMSYDWLQFRFCGECYDTYRIRRPSSEEIQHAIHKRTLRRNCNDALYKNNTMIQPLLQIIYGYLY